MKKVFVMVGVLLCGMHVVRATTILEKSLVCGACAQQASVEVLVSSLSLGGMDLDYRTSDLQRGTMRFWLQECPHCGYISPDLAQKPTFDVTYLKSKDYTTCLGKTFKEALAGRFYRASLLALRNRDADDAYWYLLCVAWCCDDAGDVLQAKRCRMTMDALYPKTSVAFRRNANHVIRHIDVLRRAGLFDKATQLCGTIQSDSQLVRRILDFQKQKCAAHDAACYTVEEVTGETKDAHL